MKYALETIESLFLTELNPDRMKITSPAIEELSNFITKITAEKSQVRSMLIEEVFSLKKEKSIELLIQRYQVALINLADDLIHAIRGMATIQPALRYQSVSIISVYQHILNCLEELLTFIEKHFNRYFNLDEKIPESYKALMQTEFRQNLKMLSKQYKHANMDPALLELIMTTFQKFIKANRSKNITYRELLYLKTLNKEFAEFLMLNEKAANQKNMIDLLLYLNFNNYFFINYYINIISKEIATAESISHQIEKLSWWQKTISQQQIKPMVAYKIKDPSVKEQLMGWISDELAFIEKKQQLNAVIPTLMATSSNAAFSILTSLSVKQAALLARLFIDTNMLKTDNQTELLTKLAGVLKTERREIISPINLRAKYYDIDEPTKSILKDLLIKMVNQLRKY